MPTVTFHIDGQMQKVTGEDGQTVLQVALDNGIPMESACGGNGFCTTCQCDVQDGNAMIEAKAVSEVNDREENMGVEGPVRRLGCQTHVFADIEVSIPDS